MKKMINWWNRKTSTQKWCYGFLIFISFPALSLFTLRFAMIFPAGAAVVALIIIVIASAGAFTAIDTVKENKKTENEDDKND